MPQESFPWSLVAAKEPDGIQITDYVQKQTSLKNILMTFGQPPSHDDLTDDEITPKEDEINLLYPTDFLQIEDSEPPKLTLKELRETVKEVTKKSDPILDPKTGTIITTDPSLRFQTNDTASLYAALPIHDGNSWCDLSVTCSDLLRMRAPFFFYDARFDKLTESQADLLEHWQTRVRRQCNRQRQALQKQLTKCHSYNVLLGHMRPKTWQTGLNDMGQQYAYRYKEMMKAVLGHSHHDRNSSRETLIRYTIPYNLLDLEGLNPMDYLTKFTVLSDIRMPYYQKIFTKYKDVRTHLIPVTKLYEPLNALMSGAFRESQIKEIIDMLDLVDETRAFDENEFYCICGLAERLFYTINLRIFGEEGLAMQQGILESADFHMFVKKMDGVKITKALSKFLLRLDLYT